MRKRIGGWQARLTAFAVVGLLLPAGAGAEGWESTLALYGWGTALGGDVKYANLEGELSVDAGNVLSSLEFGAMGRYRTQNERWAIVFDGIYASLGGTRKGALKLDLDVNQFIFQLDGAWRFSETCEAFAGARYVRLETSAEVTPSVGPGDGERFDGDATFLDPVVGLRTLHPLGEKWLLQAQADIGGGAGMDLTWQAMANLGYRPGGNYSFWLGYRALSMDFDDSGARNLFSMDVLDYGPVLGVAFEF